MMVLNDRHFLSNEEDQMPELAKTVLPFPVSPMPLPSQIRVIGNLNGINHRGIIKL